MAKAIPCARLDEYCRNAEKEFKKSEHPMPKSNLELGAWALELMARVERRRAKAAGTWPEEEPDIVTAEY